MYQKLKIAISSVILFLNFDMQAQSINEANISRKNLQTQRAQEAPKIDGTLDDTAWQNSALAENFVEQSPNNGKPEPANYRTVVKVVYDDLGIYIAAQLFDPNAENIAREFTQRDKLGNDDYFSVSINGYNDQQQAVLFLVQASGVQADAKLGVNQSDDYTGTAIWNSAVQIHQDHWVVEMKIPYFELRFPKNNTQTWGINFNRYITETNQKLSWNFVDNTAGSYTQYDGILEGMENIAPPVRLSFAPYASAYVNNYDGETTTDFVAGMDVKYGISDAFTFDMTLIPDFGQANFDANILNLSPFEQQFDEQRSFFTEGTELFSKGDMFYSRRVGGRPSGSTRLEENESLESFPGKVKLFNAMKLSGRTNKGLGIGVFNGITEKAEAEIYNEETHTTRKQVVEPWTNYNVLVLDQRFRGNSSVSFINTNVMRSGSFRDANATGLVWQLRDRNNNYQLYGNLKGSWVHDSENKTGMKGNLGIAKMAGNFRWDAFTHYTSKDWDINDLGYSTQTNYALHGVWFNYRTLQPTERFNSINLSSYANYTHRIKSFLYSKFLMNINTQLTDRKFRSYAGGIEFTPFGINDIYEPRTFGMHLETPGYFDYYASFESDSRKKLKYKLKYDHYLYNEKHRDTKISTLELRYRFSDKLNVSWMFNANFQKNDIGYVGKENGAVLMGKRDRKTYINSLSSQYTMNDKMNLTLAFRHYFSDVLYNNFYTLNQDGTLTDYSSFNGNMNGTYNAWNVDFKYSWWFAPGSQLSVLYRNSVENFLDVSGLNISDNYSRLFDEPMTHNISLRFSYFLDYNRIKNIVKQK